MLRDVDEIIYHLRFFFIFAIPMNNSLIKTCPNLTDGSLSDHGTNLRKTKKNLMQTWYLLIAFALGEDNARNTG